MHDDGEGDDSMIRNDNRDYSSTKFMTTFILLVSIFGSNR